MKKSILNTMAILMGFFVISFINVAVSHAELIEPTRTLKKNPDDPGRLTVFSEPPGLIVKVDGTSVGQTPLRIQEVPPGAHRLQVKESVTEITLEPGKTFHISLFKGKFIQFQVVRKKPVEPSEAKPYPATITWAPEPSPEQLKTKEDNREAWDRWMQFVNGSSRHF